MEAGGGVVVVAGGGVVLGKKTGQRGQTQVFIIKVGWAFVRLGLGRVFGPGLLFLDLRNWIKGYNT